LCGCWQRKFFGLKQLRSGFFEAKMKNVASRSLLGSAVLTAVVLICAISSQAQGGQLISADYGSGNYRIDVTQRLQALAGMNGQLNFQLTNEALGVRDPAPGRVKDLRIRVGQRNGRLHTFNYREKTVVTLRLDAGGPPGMVGGLQILRATYSASGWHHQGMDVTGRIQSMARNGAINVVVNNNSMGGDPAPNKRKQLRVDYVVRGRRYSNTVREGDYLRLP
jgi:hypothetical protein